MAKRGSKRKSRGRSKYKGAVNLRKLGVGYATLAVTTRGAFNENPVSFLLGQRADGSYRTFGASVTTPRISLREIFQFDQYKGDVEHGVMTQIGNNLKDNAFSMAGGYIGVAVADKVLGKIVAPKFNQMVRAIPGLGDLVKM